MIPTRDIEAHLRLGRYLFPLRKQASPDKHNDRKKPLHSAFNTRGYTPEQLYSFAADGHGLGYWLGPCDLIIDFDPRDSGAHKAEQTIASHDALLDLWETEIGDAVSHTPVVHSGGGGGGRHYYLTIPKGLKPATKHSEWPGIQFKRQNSYVVVPGSLHPSGKHYEWDIMTPRYSRGSLAPRWLINALCRPLGEQKGSTPPPEGTIEHIDHYLKQLDPADYQSRQNWLELAFVVHYELGEPGRELFMKWSAGDREYEGCDEENERMWDSIKNEQGGSKLRTRKSLRHEVLKRGGTPYVSPEMIEGGQTDDLAIDSGICNVRPGVSRPVVGGKTTARSNTKVGGIEQDSRESIERTERVESSVKESSGVTQHGIIGNSKHAAGQKRELNDSSHSDISPECSDPDILGISSSGSEQENQGCSPASDNSETRESGRSIEISDSVRRECETKSKTKIGELNEHNATDNNRDERGELIFQNIDLGALQTEAPELTEIERDSENAESETARSAKGASKKILELYIETLLSTPTDISQIELMKLIKQSFVYDRLLWHTQFRGILKNRLKIPAKVLDDLYKNAEKHILEQSGDNEQEQEIDNPELIALEVQSKHTNLISATNQILYEWIETHWRPLMPNTVKKYVYGAAKRLGLKTSHAFAATENVLTARTAVEADVFRFQAALPSVINTQNREVWMHRQTGEVIAKKHKPKSYLTSVLDVQYIPNATCELFDSTLNDIFGGNADMVRHFWEFLGYTIQPIKNIPCWWLWHGSGANGKSMLLKLVECLIGDAYLPRPIGKLSDGGSSHAVTSLVGKLLVADDDADTKTQLPASALKKLAEQHTREADPKFGHMYKFTCTATPLVLINDWPGLSDISKGMLRKSYVLPFRQSFDENDPNTDINRLEKIKKSEMPGILNRAIKGLQCLRARGRFLEPEACKSAKTEWLRVSNPLYDFARMRLKEMVPVSVDFAYKTYSDWCKSTSGIKFPLTMQRFEQMLRHLEYRVVDGEVLK